MGIQFARELKLAKEEAIKLRGARKEAFARSFGRLTLAMADSDFARSARWWRVDDTGKPATPTRSVKKAIVVDDEGVGYVWLDFKVPGEEPKPERAFRVDIQEVAEDVSKLRVDVGDWIEVRGRFTTSILEAFSQALLRAAKKRV